MPWFDHLTRRVGRPELTQLNASTIPYLLAIVVAATVGAVLASRLPRHPVGWLLLAVGLSVAGSGVADGYARYGLVARPGALPALAGAVLVAIVVGFFLGGGGAVPAGPPAHPAAGGSALQPPPP